MSKPKLSLGRIVLYIPISLALCGIGLFLMMDFMTFLLGILCLLLSAGPYVYWLSKHITNTVAYDMRDHSVNEGDDKPWETEEVDEEILNIVLNTKGRGQHGS